ncbi:MAG TPA: TIGR04282 family arsenosugar biosynthesis glycosyltransferase [Burkholderiaceae bacterium]|nr:TIGR04282 family arsenosugar biosynthesis glycosyltransferase [Burkholderiaceae bacterium]
MSVAQLAIAVFARTPVAGQAKTRLIPALGPEGAARLQGQLIARALARAQAVAPNDTWLWLTGAHLDLPCDAAVKRVWQVGEHLGARMTHAFAQMLPESEAVIVIGTDCPAQRAQDLRQAARALETADAVFQPALDGGYVLVGLHHRVLRDEPERWPQLFAQIAWGSEAVYAQTQARLIETGLRAAALPARPDLDWPQDYVQAVEAGWIDSVNQAVGPHSC